MMIKAETDAPAYLAQQPTLKLSTPPATQPGVNDNVWGALIPKSKGLAGYEFHKARGQHTYLIGSRSRGGGEIGEPVDIVLPNTGSLDCRIQWDGGSAAWIVDFSDNGAGVFKNDSRLKRGEYNFLRSGDEIAFGIDTTSGHSGEDHVHRFRFVYYNRLPDPPASGVEQHYDFIYVLGKGAYATVYKASSRENARWYAVKVIDIQQLSLSPDWVKDLANGPPTDPDVKKLLKEVTILERLNHKNICHLKEYFVERHRISLVMELVEGGDLWAHLKAKGRAMTESETGQIIYQICDALAYIHTHNIAHRDLKLENVLLTLDNPPVVQVADFGLAKALSTLSDLRTFCGTLAYIAPEVAMKDNDRYTVVVVADSWSLGIMAFNMLTFESRPYMKGVTDADRQIQVTTRQVNWELLKKHGLSKQCERFLRGLLEYDPLRRTTMAAALRDPWLRAHAPKALSSPRENLLPASLSAEVPAPAHTPAGRQLVHDIIPPSEPQPARRARRRTTSGVTAKEAEQQSSDTHTGVAVVDDARVKGTGRARKRKVQDRSDASLSLAIKLEMSKDIDAVAAGAAAAAMEPAKSGGKGKRTAARAPAKKKVHTGGARMTMPAADDSDEVPGLVLPRRSPRLNSPRL